MVQLVVIVKQTFFKCHSVPLILVSAHLGVLRHKHFNYLIYLLKCHLPDFYCMFESLNQNNKHVRALSVSERCCCIYVDPAKLVRLALNFSLSLRL